MNRAIAPEYSKAQHIDLVVPQRIKLTDKIDLYWLDETQDDTVKLDMTWDAGSKYQSKKLTASFTNALLLAGTDKLSANEISEKIDFQGGYVSQDLDKDQGGVTLYGLSNKIETIFDIFSENFSNAIFPDSEVEKLIDIRKNGFKISMEKVSTLCRQDFNKHIFGQNNEYGKVAALEDFDKVKASDLQAFYKSIYLGTKPTLFLVGKVDDSFIDKLRTWAESLGTSTSTVINTNFEQTKGRIEITKKDAIQTSIRIGRLMVQKNHPDYYKFQVLNTILGGYFGSRLMANIREDKGYTYGIGSGLSVLDDSAYFFISAEVAKEVVDDTMKEIYIEIDKLKNEYVSKNELKKVKNYLLGDFLRGSDGAIAMMENFKNIYFNNLSEDYYIDFIHAVNNVTAKQLKDLANKYLDKSELLEVLAG
jgi:zinc protease